MRAVLEPVAPKVTWRKSSASAQGNCVETAYAAGVLVRDSKDPAGPVLVFPDRIWAVFLGGTAPAPASRIVP